MNGGTKSVLSGGVTAKKFKREGIKEYCALAHKVKKKRVRRESMLTLRKWLPSHSNSIFIIVVFCVCNSCNPLSSQM